MNIHFIAIGGSVMHQLALALQKKGYHITGSDDEIFEPASGNLRQAGLLPEEMGWFPGKIHAGLDAVILGMHAKNDNPELVRAKELQLNIYSFPEYIYQESIDKTRVVVGGSHGKTTTTAMIMHVLNKAGKDFDYLVGARLEGFEQSVRISDAPILVAEGDEYPASVIEKRPKFHFLFPQIAIITGIAWDHINVFPTFEIYLEQFTIYIGKIEKGGLLIYNQSDPVLKELVEKHARNDIRYQPYDIPPHAIHDGTTTVTIDGESALLQVFGDHNLLNLHAAWYACEELGVDADAFTRAIASFGGAAKRLELLSKNDQTAVYRDFAHAPSKVKATIDAVKQQYPDRTLIAVLELHTFSSLNEKFMDQYQAAMDKADKAVVYYSNHALELKRLPPLDPAGIREGFAKEGLVVMNSRDSLMKWMEEQQYGNSNLLLMSSGNYDGADMLTFAKIITGKL